MEIQGHIIQGAIDNETRCKHYHSELDRVALKFYCCESYFPCFQCHIEYGCGASDVWPKDHFDKKAVMCGTCGQEITINEYLNGSNQCPHCAAAFNPGCSLHAHLYFEV
ncbi:hypothetical protein KQI49_13550 [Virgibacillus sp. MSJ-26]|uniref:CHY zinc finger protein n=1 Tax=Virgibacillus sp. MSJ-26 TaxID=2841522 RepID=UPI001C11EE88|nr:CHY zinc finger protein [Virgibacillus sp. MSJ-26]MBU5467849.1 hypothetical protein [Virgibacillus sp. MSJ-26]